MSAAKIKVPKALDGQPLIGALACPVCGFKAPLYGEGQRPIIKYKCPNSHLHAKPCPGILEFKPWEGQTGPETAGIPIPGPDFLIRKKEPT